MNTFSGFARPTIGGYHAMLRFARDASPKPVLGEGGKPIIFPSECEAWKAIAKHLCAYFNGDLRRDGETLTSARAAADAAFPGLIRQKGSSRYTAVERRRA
ncbi:MAG TPA: hypothetical protein VFT89_07420 [Rhizobiaceae bacterium]|nr:hypothetical protein [Rhizobiaceae bacterium]